MNPAPGTLVAHRFRIDKRTGAGGMGVVYRGVDTLTGKPAAIKVLLADDTDELARFEREARVLSMMSHPGIVAFLGYGKLDSGEAFLAMEWLEGCDLAEKLKREHLSVGESLLLVRNIARALDVAHGQGVVHRDLKPGNLFLRNEKVDQVVLLDFGIARHLVVETKLTQMGAVIGTPYYMAPEQAAGHQDVTPAADIFSLGCVLFECLTGKPPFEGMHSLAVLSKIIFEEAPPLETRLPDVDARLSALCARMLAKQPAERFVDARALWVALDELGPLTTEKTILALPKGARSADTMSISAVKRAVLTVDELEVVCVIAMQCSASAGDATQEIQSVTTSLVALGLRVEQLPDGTLVSTLSRMGQATDQVLRAARAAIWLFERFSGARVALATGRARVGKREGMYVGDAIDSVFRILDLARSAEGVHIDKLTAGLLDERFVVVAHEHGAVLRGERVIADESKRLLGRPTPCVGRERELGTLQSYWEGCLEEASARAVLVIAPAGVGKSRLRHEFLQRVQQTRIEHTLLLGRADPVASAALGVVARALRVVFGLELQDEPAVLRAKIEAFVRNYVPASEARAITEFMGEFVGVPFSEESNLRLHLARQDARIMTDQMTAAFVALLQHLSKVRPVLLVLEDLHWCDAFSVSVVGAALRELKSEPLFVLAFARPDVQATFPKLWPNHLEQISLAPLRARAGIQLAREILGESVDSHTLQRIVDLSSGNVLFLEELIRAVADGRGNELPETVLAMLQSRIGRLDPDVRRALRAASIWGLTCPEEGLRALVGGHTDLTLALRSLVEHEILERRRPTEATGDVEYAFRHALVRDAAYALLVDEDRILGHRLVAEWLEVRGNADPAVLAEHFHLGGEFERMVPYCVRAVAHLQERGDFHRGRRFADLGIAAGATGTSLGVLLALRAWLVWYTDGVKAWPTTRPDAERATELLTPAHPWWFRALSSMSSIDLLFGEHERAVRLISRMISGDVPDGVGAEYVMSCWALTALLCQVGRRELAKQLIDRTCEVIEEKSPHIPVVRAWRESMRLEYQRHTQRDPWKNRHELEEIVDVCAKSGVTQFHELALLRNTLALANAEIGDHATAERFLRESIENARRKGYGYLVTHAQIHLAESLCVRAGKLPVEEIQSLTRDLLATEGLSPGFVALSHSLRAMALLDAGEVAQAEINGREAVKRSGNFPIRRLRMQSTLLRALVQADKRAEALELAREVREQVDKLGKVGYAEVPIHTAMAMAFRASGETEQPMEHLHIALAEVNRQASSIPEGPLRDRFRKDVADNVRVIALAEEWGVDAGV